MVSTRSTSDLGTVTVTTRSRGAKRGTSTVQPQPRVAPSARKSRKKETRKTQYATQKDRDEKEKENRFTLAGNAPGGSGAAVHHETPAREDEHTDTEYEDDVEREKDGTETLRDDTDIDDEEEQDGVENEKDGTETLRDDTDIDDEEEQDGETRDGIRFTNDVEDMVGPVERLGNGGKTAGAQMQLREEAVVVTEELRETWRRWMSDVRKISIRHTCKLTRPMKTLNCFVTKITVFLAYLIVHAEAGKPFPKISKRFKLDERAHDFDEMGKEIMASDFPYTGHYNDCVRPHDHIVSSLAIGTWLANTVNKVKYQGTWNVREDGVITGVKNGLYEPYKDCLEKIGVCFPALPRCPPHPSDKEHC